MSLLQTLTYIIPAVLFGVPFIGILLLLAYVQYSYKPRLAREDKDKRKALNQVRQEYMVSKALERLN